LVRAPSLYLGGPWFESRHAHQQHFTQMDPQKQQEIFEDKYQDKLGVAYGTWMETAPETENEAYSFCKQLDDELKATYDEWYESEGEDREKLEDYRDRLKLEYDIIEELFGLELKDR
jgi:hypothetical protein